MSSTERLEIITYPNPILEQVAEEITFPLDSETKKLIQRMWVTVEDIGVGLAAPQVGVSKQLCIIHLSQSDLSPKLKQKDFVVINPKITFYSQVEASMVEGCLSFPEQYYDIWRPANILVEYFDELGKKHKLQASGWLARVLQHEIDHLAGKLFINMGGKKLEEKDIKDKPID
jgi:peptide deformylase